MRIAKLIAHSGLCSRREAERWIEDGRVAVDGKTLTTAAFIVEDASTVMVDGAPLPAKEQPAIWLWHKPKGVITSRSDPQGRLTIYDVLPQAQQSLISVGRLDYNTEGLLLLTNHGPLARYMELPSTGWVRTYRARAFGVANHKKRAQLERGITLDGTRYAPMKITDVKGKDGGSNQWFDISITEGKYREIRILLEYTGLTVNRLIRTSYGPFHLAKLRVEEVQPAPHNMLINHFPKEVYSL